MAALTLITAGESHGPGLTCIVEGLPAGLELDREAVNRDMARRQLGRQRPGAGGLPRAHEADQDDRAARRAYGLRLHPMRSS